jgi:hypothetical protein
MLQCQQLVITDPTDLIFELEDIDFFEDDGKIVCLFAAFTHDSALKGVLIDRPTRSIYSNDSTIKSAVEHWIINNKDSLVVKNALENMVSLSTIIHPLFSLGYLSGNSINDVLISGIIYKVGNNWFCKVSETRNTTKALKAVFTLLINRYSIPVLSFELLDPKYYGQILTYNQVFNVTDDAPTTRKKVMTVAKIRHFDNQLKTRLIDMYTTNPIRFTKIANSVDFTEEELLTLLQK